MAPSDPPTGRGDELAALDHAVTALTAGRGGIVWIEGEPGIGKSTLVSAVLADASARGCAVHRAMGDELGQRLPLRALIDALGGEAGSEVAALLHPEGSALAAGIDAVPAGVERFLVVIDRLCAAAPLLLAFDDLQWADEASLLTWHRLGLAVDQIPLLLVSACRPVPARPAVSRLRRGVVSRGAALLAVGPLSDDAVNDLVTKQAGAAPGQRLREAIAHAGGNPLYTGELVDALIRDDRVKLSGDTAELVGTVDQVPLELTGAINARLDFLSPDTANALRVAAMLGAPVLGVRPGHGDRSAHQRVAVGARRGDRRRHPGRDR